MSGLRGLFVVGTDTGVGKTRVAAAIARAMTHEGRRVGILKPVMTGVAEVWKADQMDDADQLLEALGVGWLGSRFETPVSSASTPGSRSETPATPTTPWEVPPKAIVCPIVYPEPLAPSVAARRLGRPLAADDLYAATSDCLAYWRDVRGAEVMVVEGVGGLLCPLAEGITVADLAVRLDYPLVVVARRGLGTLNHTLLTVEAALSRALRVAGVILNGSEPTADPVAEATNPAELARRLGRVPILAELPHGIDEEAVAVVMNGLDWYNRASGPRLPFPAD